MAEEDPFVELLKFYKEKATVTRPEVGILTSKTVGQIAGVCNRHNIKPWPDISESVLQNRPCQFPILKNGERRLCGLLRSAGIDADPLRCSDHRDQIWDPKTEK